VPLGLHEGAVALCPHDPRWPALGEEECSTVKALLGHLAIDVQHVGSTAVPGLDAKPILDIAVALDQGANRGFVDDVVRRMESGGFQYRGDHGPDGGLMFVKAIGDVRTVHVHMVTFDDPEWSRYICFRDYLRTVPERRDAYQRLKHQLADRYASDRDGYTNAKTGFVMETLRQAEDVGHEVQPQDWDG
jgi:GrpB-like predicted nucleotidyltransferase (UPF0157 family)